jgi:predicted O-methyltransferase YrrM
MPRSETFELLQVASEFEPVVAIYRKRKPKRVLEIGCWDGGTLKVRLEEAAPKTVVAVDLNHRNSDAYEDWRKELTVLHVVKGSSQDEGIVDEMREHGPYDWAFIDGDHGPSGVRSDYENVRNLMAPGGVIVFHDIVGEFQTPYAPGQIVDELEDGGLRVERFVDPEDMPWAHGLGVVYL